MSACVERKLLDRHFAGTIGVEDERVMRAHLPTCAACTAYHRRHLLLAQLDPEALPAEERIGRGLGFASTRAADVLADPDAKLPRPGTLHALAPRRVARLAGVGTGILALAAATLLFVRAHHDADDGFTARGGPATPASHLLVYDVAPGAPPKLASTAVARGDGLAFAYENGGGKSNLMIFGIDESRRVYWFYPAWTSESDDPEAISIERDPGRHMLPDTVEQDVEGTRLEVHALFTDASTKLSVRRVEALLREHPSAPLPVPGAIEATVSLTVSPAR